MKPVGVSEFLNDDRVKEITGDTEGGLGEIVYEHPEDHAPVLSAVASGVTKPLVENEIYRLVGSGVAIMADNADDFDGFSVEWFFYDEGGDSFVYTGISSNGFPVSTANEPFNVAGIYQLVAVGKIEGIPYSTGIFIWVD